MSLKETAAEVAALIPRYSWEIMDEEQRDELMVNVVLPRYMETTADGAKLGPTWWAEQIGGTARAFESRVYRIRQSQSGNVDAGQHARHTRSERAKSVLRNADEQTVEEIVSALPTQAVERIMHSATNELGERDRKVPSARPVGKSLFQRFADHCFAGWKLQDEMQDQPPPTGDELVRFRNVAEANRAFAEASLRWLETGDFDLEVAALLEEVQGS